jgi:hypothetical protein
MDSIHYGKLMLMASLLTLTTYLLKLTNSLEQGIFF